MRFSKNVVLFAMAALARTASADVGQPGWPTYVWQSLAIPQGTLAIHSVGINGYQFRLNDRTLAEVEASPATIVSSGTVNSGQYFVIDIGTGGRSCTDLFRILKIDSDGSVAMSREFGNCSPVPLFSSQNNEIEADFPPRCRLFLTSLKSRSLPGAQMFQLIFITRPISSGIVRFAGGEAGL